MSKKVWIGKVSGPQGETGKQGEQGEQGKHGERGTRWHDGDRITGISTEPMCYPTGIIDALPEDYYLNSKNGNIYRCTLGGDEHTAQWVFVGNIKGAMPSVEDTFESTSNRNALSANAGRVLHEKITAAGIFPKELKISCELPIYAVKVTVENKDTSISLKDSEGKAGLYNYTKTGNGENAEVLIWLGKAIGLPSGCMIIQVSSTNAGILRYELYDADNQVVESYSSNVWETLKELTGDHERQMTITEENGNVSSEYDAYMFSKIEQGVRKEGFPISHVKAIWWDKQQNKTLYDRLKEGLFDSEQIICDPEELQGLEEKSAGMFVPDAYLMGQLMHYVYNMPVIRSGTGEPDDSVGKDGDIYIMLESDGE